MFFFCFVKTNFPCDFDLRALVTFWETLLLQGVTWSVGPLLTSREVITTAFPNGERKGLPREK